MAITASGVYVTNFIDKFDTTQLAINLDLDTHKVALYLDASRSQLLHRCDLFGNQRSSQRWRLYDRWTSPGRNRVH